MGSPSQRKVSIISSRSMAEISSWARKDVGVFHHHRIVAGVIGGPAGGERDLRLPRGGHEPRQLWQHRSAWPPADPRPRSSEPNHRSRSAPIPVRSPPPVEPDPPGRMITGSKRRVSSPRSRALLRAAGARASAARRPIPIVTPDFEGELIDRSHPMGFLPAGSTFFEDEAWLIDGDQITERPLREPDAGGPRHWPVASPVRATTCPIPGG